MARNIRSHVTTPDGAQIPFFVYGNGSIPLVFIPSLEDGIRNVIQEKRRLARLFQCRAANFRILMLSRRKTFPEGFSIEQQAADAWLALDQLRWPAFILEAYGAAGGPVGQQMVIQRPERVRGLILSFAMHRTVQQTRQVLQAWKTFSQEKRWNDLTLSMSQHTLQPTTAARYRWLHPIFGIFRSPTDPLRFPRMIDSLLELNQAELLPRINAPTLIICGERDQVIPLDVQREMATLIPGSELKVYPDFGNGNAQNNPDYEEQVQNFVNRIL